MTAAYDRAVSEQAKLLTATELRTRLRKQAAAADGDAPPEPPKPLA